jgi:hypothetical protein
MRVSLPYLKCQSVQASSSHRTQGSFIPSLPHVLRDRHFSIFQIEEMDFHETKREASTIG